MSSTMLEIFTDGTFDVERRCGAWAFVVLEDGCRVHEACGSGIAQSNNAFEVLAAVEAMSWVDASALGRPVALRTDSLHVVEGCNRWRAIWRKNGWKRIDPNPRNRRRAIPDAAVWKKLDDLIGRHPEVAVSWCKGHSGIDGNEHADRLARSEITVDQRYLR